MLAGPELARQNASHEIFEGAGFFHIQSAVSDNSNSDLAFELLKRGKILELGADIVLRRDEIDTVTFTQENVLLCAGTTTLGLSS